jgi:hypothetical protein
MSARVQPYIEASMCVQGPSSAAARWCGQLLMWWRGLVPGLFTAGLQIGANVPSVM